MWECACGSTCKECVRHDHLSKCRMFIRSWRAAFHALARSLYSQRQLVDDSGGTTHHSQAHTLEKRVELLEKAIVHHQAKQVILRVSIEQKKKKKHNI
jgi:hypothetical protein